MIAIPYSSMSVKSKAEFEWRERFLQMLPSIARHAQICFRHLPVQTRQEAVQAVVVTAFIMYAQLAELGKGQVAYIGALARYAVRRVRDGRTVETPVNFNDITSRWCQCRRGICVESLDDLTQRGDWRECLVESRRSTPADTAAARIDFQDWLARLPRRQRAIAELLATGETTKGVSQRFGITPGRVSQLRQQLYTSWNLWQGENAGTDLAKIN
jgi:hypothetical protein